MPLDPPAHAWLDTEAGVAQTMIGLGSTILICSDSVTALGLGQAIEASIDDDDMTLMYLEVLDRHIQQLSNSCDSIEALQAELGSYSPSIQGDIGKIGLLLSDLAPEPHPGVRIPLGITWFLLLFFSGTTT